MFLFSFSRTLVNGKHWSMETLPARCSWYIECSGLQGAQFTQASLMLMVFSTWAVSGHIKQMVASMEKMLRGCFGWDMTPLSSVCVGIASAFVLESGCAWSAVDGGYWKSGLRLRVL